MPAPPRLRTRQAAELIGISKSTLEKMRMRGDGPPYLLLGNRVFYEPAAISAWIDSRRFTRTGQYRADERPENPEDLP